MNNRNVVKTLNDYNFNTKYIVGPESFTMGSVTAKPPKTWGPKCNSYKICKKIDSDTMEVVQPTNKGCVKYTFKRNIGASGTTDFGAPHDKFRIIKAKDMQYAYVYWDAITAHNPEVLSTVLREPSYLNNVEQVVTGITSGVTVSNSFSSKPEGKGMGCYKLPPGETVRYQIPLSGSSKCNILFYCDINSTDLVEIFVGTVKVKEFDPRAYRLTSPSESYNYCIVDFDIPFRGQGDNPIGINIKNTGVNKKDRSFYICALNYFPLTEYKGQTVNNYKVLGTDNAGWIDSAGASDYAFITKGGKVLGSYHGGEKNAKLTVSWGSKQIIESPIYQSYVDLDTIKNDTWVLSPEFSIYQMTSLAGNVNNLMITEINLSTDGTIDMDFSFNSVNGIEFETMYTALTCTHFDFYVLKYPARKIFSPTEHDGKFFHFECSEGKVIQENPKAKLEMCIRYTKFNRSCNERSPYIANNNTIYRKFYDAAVYHPPRTKTNLVKSLSFSKSIDFRIL